jgi:CheY-like chemotaxis protein
MALSALVVVAEERNNGTLVGSLESFQGLFHTVQVANSVREAIPLFSREPPDLILLDVLCCADSLCGQLRELESAVGKIHAPILSVTRVTEVGQLERMFEAGVDTVLASAGPSGLLRTEIAKLVGVAEEN